MDFSQPEDTALRAWSDLADAAAAPSVTAMAKQHEWDQLVVAAEINRLLLS